MKTKQKYTFLLILSLVAAFLIGNTLYIYGGGISIKEGTFVTYKTVAKDFPPGYNTIVQKNMLWLDDDQYGQDFINKYLANFGGKEGVAYIGLPTPLQYQYMRNNALSAELVGSFNGKTRVHN